MTLDVFLESFEEFDRDAVETALARNGIAGGNATVQTADGGEAQLELDDDGVVLFVRTLTREEMLRALEEAKQRERERVTA